MKKNEESARMYIFCGDGAGVPGLPHEISEEDARERGLLEQLLEAIRAGVYRMEHSQNDKPEEA